MWRPQEKFTRGATTMRASWETEPLTPSRGRGWLLRCRARRSTEWPVARLTPSPGPPASPPMLGSYPHRCCTSSGCPPGGSKSSSFLVWRFEISAFSPLSLCFWRSPWSTTTCRRSPSWASGTDSSCCITSLSFSAPASPCSTWRAGWARQGTARRSASTR